MKRTYQGDPLETGGTSMNFRGGVSPAVKWLFHRRHITEGMNVLDFGAGKYDRNAKFLREWGVNVWSYDPYHGYGLHNGLDGVSMIIRDNTRFDVVFTSFVLNVVPDHVETQILKRCEALADKQFHVVRADLYNYVYRALHRREKTVTDFFLNEFGGTLPDAHHYTYTDKPPVYEVIEDFCYFGTKTTKGFQRMPQLKEKEFEVLAHKNNGFTVYTK